MDIFDLFDRDDRRDDRGRRGDRNRRHRDHDDDHDDDDDDDHRQHARHARRDHDDDDDDRDHRRSPARHQPRRDRDRDHDHDRDRSDRHRGGSSSLWSRRAHPHAFAWLLLAGGAVLIGLLVIGLLSALGLWGPIADAYFAASRAILPTSWHDEWAGLPGIAHVALGLALVFVAVGVAGEIFD